MEVVVATTKPPERGGDASKVARVAHAEVDASPNSAKSVSRR